MKMLQRRSERERKVSFSFVSLSQRLCALLPRRGMFIPLALIDHGIDLQQV